MKYINVILPIKLTWEPFYRSQDDSIRIGQRVSVVFAGRKYIGVVSNDAATPNVDVSKIKDILTVEQRMEEISEHELKLWRFIADYYLCTIGEVYKSAYSGQRTSSEQAAARKTERLEKKNEAARVKLYSKIEKLSDRLEKKEKELQSFHSERVMSRLISERDNILALLDHAQHDLLLAESSDSPDSSNLWQHHNPDTDSSISAMFGEKKTVLLQGNNDRWNTVSQLAADTLNSQKDVLILTPEIAGAESIASFLRVRFHGNVRLFHSAEKESVKRETLSILRNPCDNGRDPVIVIGTCAAVFLPFSSLGLVVVDEEQDSSYKKDNSPRFNGRDTAVMLGSIHNAYVLLCSPAPSLESLYNVSRGRYGMLKSAVSGFERILIDTAAEKRKNGMVGSLSRILIREIDRRLRNSERVLILRTWGPLDDLKDEIKIIWNDVQGIDFMSVYDARHSNLEAYSAVALLSAETLIDRYSFRADERAVQILEQLREKISGDFIIQTKNSEHPVFEGYENTVGRLMEERKLACYPPYTRMLDIVFKDSNIARMDKLSAELAFLLSDYKPMGPFNPARANSGEDDTRILRFILDRNSSLQVTKRKIADIISDFESESRYSGHIIPDVDPV